MSAALVSDPRVQPELRRLWLEAAGREGVEVTEVPGHRLSLSVDENRCEVLFDGRTISPDVVVLRTAGVFMPLLTLADKLWQERGIETINSTKSVNIARDKLATSLVLYKSEIPFVPTLGFYRGGDIEKISSATIVKPAVGSQGNGVTMYSDSACARESLGDTVKAREEGHLVAQPFLGPYGHDLRCFVVDGECVSMMRRHALPGGFINNTNKGGRVESLYLREAADLAVKATESLGLFYAGVDIVESNPMRVLEVNSLPSFVKLKEATDVNPADYIWRGIKRRTGCG